MIYVASMLLSILWGVFCAILVRPAWLAVLLAGIGGYFIFDLLWSFLFGV